MDMDKYPITAEGFNRLEAELKNLKSVERPDVIKAIAVAREHGDLKENAEYHAAREKQSFIEARISLLEGVTSFAEVIDISAISGDIIRFGAHVVVYDEDSDEEVSYQIVGEHEADIALKRLSVTAPLARALLGKSDGDVVDVVTPKGKKSYEVCGVSFK
mgnify:CR=1 FL=1